MPNNINDANTFPSRALGVHYYIVHKLHYFFLFSLSFPISSHFGWSLSLVVASFEIISLTTFDNPFIGGECARVRL